MQNALLGLGEPSPLKLDLVGPTVDDDIQRAIWRYGLDAVQDAVKRKSKKKRGRKAEPDWPELSKVFKVDARRLLEGGDPFAERTNYSIATEYAERFPGHNRAATHRRILKKLAAKRVLFTLINAHSMSEKECPYSAHLAVLVRLEREAPDWGWAKRLAFAEQSVRDYKAKHGEPDEGLTMEEIEQGARALIWSDRGHDDRPAGGMFGLLSPPKA